MMATAAMPDVEDHVPSPPEGSRPRSLTQSEDNALTQRLGSLSIDELKDKPGLAKAVSNAPEYVETYFELKRLDSGQKDGKELRSRPPSMGLKRHDSQVAENLGAVTWGLPLRTCFNVALQYIASGTVKLPYSERNQMYALKRQALKGPFSVEKMPELGWFDWVGHDIRKYWEALGDMDDETAMANFCRMLQSLDPNWSEYLLDEKRIIDEELKKEWERQETLSRQQSMSNKSGEHLDIRGTEGESAPGSPGSGRRAVVRTPDEERRRRLEELVQKKRELEEMEKHIRRESQKVDDEMRMLSQEGADQWRGAAEAHEAPPSSDHHRSEVPNIAYVSLTSPELDPIPSRPNSAASDRSLPPLDFDEWLAEVKQNEDSSFNVARGDEVTVRVRTPGRVTTWWEYATEAYDISFSVFLEYQEPESSHTSVIPILPAMRKDCEGRVVRGSHHSPYPGVYLLKFDNSFSYWRAKEIFFRVYTTAQS